MAVVYSESSPPKSGLSGYDPIADIATHRHAGGMTRRLVFMLLSAFVAVASAPVAAQTVDTAKEAARVESECGLKSGTIKVTGDQIRHQPSPDEA